MRAQGCIDTTLHVSIAHVTLCSRFARHPPASYTSYTLYTCKGTAPVNSWDRKKTGTCGCEGPTLMDFNLLTAVLEASKRSKLSVAHGQAGENLE